MIKKDEKDKKYEKDKLHGVIYEDNESLVHEVLRILNLEKPVVDRLREKARIKVVEQFTYKILTKRILSLLNEA